MGTRSVVLATLVLPAALLVLLAAHLVLLSTASAQSYAMQGWERYFRIESTSGPGRRGPVVSGYVHNIYGHTAGNVRLVIESLDGAGQVTASTIVQVLGTIGPGDRAYFETAAPREGASYRVRVLSFDPVGRGT